MFESVEVDAAGPVACADVLVDSIAAERRATARKLAAVAQWADLHHPDRDIPQALPAAEKARRRCREQLGADGTPVVSTYAVTELGVLLQTTTYAAEALLRDVLELRHRLPRTWDAVLTGRLEAWKGRQVAKATRSLHLDQARAVDGTVIEALIGLPWGRALAVVEGKVIATDPDGHESRRQDEESRHYVSTRRRSNRYGVRTLIARGAAGDIARLEAMVAHLAELMARAGEPGNADTRRAKALAVLANPALACVFLARAHESSTASADGAGDGHAAPTLFDEPGCDPGEAAPAPPSAVELAVAFGKVLKKLGAQALERLRPRSVLYLHLAAEAVEGRPGTGVVRVDDPIAGGPIGITQLREWLGNDRVTVKPVIDPTGAEPVDAHEIPLHLREAMNLLVPYEVFPYGTLAARQADGDHTVPYVPPDDGGPPGQTALDNLGPLGRRHHLAKTFGGFTVHQPVRGLFLWRTPTGHWFRVDHRGTARLGKEHPPALALAERHAPEAMTVVERRFREELLVHVAA